MAGASGMVLSAPALAAVDTPALASPALNAYARARLADDDGALSLAASSYREALKGDPTNDLVAIRSYRQAMESGDMQLALAAAKVLDADGSLPRDGVLLLAADALVRKDWATARTIAGRIEAQQNFSFLAPLLRSWISVGDGPYAPPQIVPGSSFASLGRRYLDEHMALQALALGHVDDATVAIDRTVLASTEPFTGFRLVAAMRLAALGDKDKALSYVPKDDPVLAVARQQIEGKGRISAPAMTPAQGFARLLARIADDLSSDDTRQLSLILTRIASFADVANPEFHLSLARRLVAGGHADAALQQIAQIAPQSPFAEPAQEVKVDALSANGDAAGAVALATQIAARPDAGPAQWVRLANILAADNELGAAADAYATAQKLYPADSTPWTLYLLQGSVLERQGKWDDAHAALDKAAALAPNEPVVLNYLGYAQIERRQNVPAALALLKRASALKPGDPQITDSLGWAHYIAGDAGAAVPVLEQAVAGAPDDVTINEHLGDALWAVGRRYEARYAWSAASAFAEGDAAQRIGDKVREGLRPELAAP